MPESPHDELLRVLERVFGDRITRASTRRGERGNKIPLATASPTSVEEVELLARTAGRYSIPIVAQGAGTGPETGTTEGSILVRFDLMRGMRLPDGEEPWVEAEPGASWLELDDNLSVRGRGLAVYPTSAPRATIGGWLATDGIGVGSFEYGRLYENVLSASVVEPGGGLLEIKGEELEHFFGPGRARGVVVSARLRTRRRGEDRVFAASFEDARDLAGAVGDLVSSDAPLWHLAFVSPVMAAARGLRASFLLFGVYPSGKDGETWWELRRRVIKTHGGSELDIREAGRVWGERFFPVAPGHPTPEAAREFVRIADLPKTLNDASSVDALQGTVSRSGEVLLLTLGAADGEEVMVP